MPPQGYRVKLCTVAFLGLRSWLFRTGVAIQIPHRLYQCLRTGGQHMSHVCVKSSSVEACVAFLIREDVSRVRFSNAFDDGVRLEELPVAADGSQCGVK